MEIQRIKDQVKAKGQDLVAFAQKLVQTPSLPGQEGDVAALIQAEMTCLGYDEVWIDEAGNVIGRIDGGDGPSLMFNGHMDHVDAGEPDLWTHPPFGGELIDDELWGRGAADMKGALAAMVYAGGLIKELDVQPPGDLYVCGAVQEEIGGLGSQYLARSLAVDRAVIGEASHCQLRRGHRGRLEFVAHFEGRSVHASMPDLGVNPHFSMTRFLQGLRDLEMASDPTYGASTVAPTRVVSEPTSANVTPAALRLVLDWRNIPFEDAAQCQARLKVLLLSSLEPGCQGRIELAHKDLVSYTGLKMGYPDIFPSFTTAEDHPWLESSRKRLTAALGRPVEVGIWRFATDGGHLAAAGVTVIGLGPGDASVVHTVQERLPLDELEESVVAYMVLGLN